MREFAPGYWPPGASALDVAMTQLGVRETSRNRGPQVDAYLRAVGLDPEKGEYAWCAAFAYWCCQQAGLWIPRTAHVGTLWARRESMVVAQPAPGDICVRVNTDGTGHCGIFERWLDHDDGPWISSVDGNTDSAGGREGDCVAIRARRADWWNRGFLHPVRLETDAA